MLGIGHRREQDESLGRLAAERGHQVHDAVAQQVVAEVHDERGVAQIGLGGQDGVRQAERLVLLDVLDGDAEGRAVARGGADLGARLGGDDDADLLDAGSRHRLDPVEQDGLVGHGHELLCTRVGERTQARARAAGENQALNRPLPACGGPS